ISILLVPLSCTLFPYTTLFRSFYKKLIKLRNNEPALQVGNFIPVPSEENIFSFIREYAGKKFLIALNFGSSEEKCEPGLKDWKRSEEHTSELQSRDNLVCRLLL